MPGINRIRSGSAKTFLLRECFEAASEQTGFKKADMLISLQVSDDMVSADKNKKNKKVTWLKCSILFFFFLTLNNTSSIGKICHICLFEMETLVITLHQHLSNSEMLSKQYFRLLSAGCYVRCAQQTISWKKTKRATVKSLVIRLSERMLQDLLYWLLLLLPMTGKEEKKQKGNEES